MPVSAGTSTAKDPSGAIGTVPSSMTSLPACTIYEWPDRVVRPLPASTRMARTWGHPAVVLLVNRAFWQKRKPVAFTSPTWPRFTCAASTGGLGRAPRKTGECNAMPSES